MLLRACYAQSGTDIGACGTRRLVRLQHALVRYRGERSAIAYAVCLRYAPTLRAYARGMHSPAGAYAYLVLGFLVLSVGRLGTRRDVRYGELGEYDAEYGPEGAEAPGFV
eukprot:2735751-Rhodomonas_salina.1